MAERPEQLGGEIDVATVLESAPPAVGVPRIKPQGRWAVQVKYDPDAATSSDKYMTPTPLYARRFGVAPDAPLSTVPTEDGKRAALEKYGVTIPGHGPSFIARDAGGQVMLPIQEGGRWKPVLFENISELKQLNETGPGRLKRLMEDRGGSALESGGFDFEGGSGQDASRLWNTEFVPIMGGPFFKQLYIYDYLLMHSTAFEMTNHNALAAAAIKIMQRFTIGRGLSYYIKDDAVKAVWDEFWRRTDMKNKFRQMARDLPWQGELMLRFYEKSKGYTALRCLDPSTCWEVVTDPEDFDQVFYYHFQWPCLHGSTKIACLDGTNPTIAELAERQAQDGKSAWVYSYDHEQRRIVPGEASKIWKAGRKRCIEVELDNGEKIIASFDHPFMRRDGTYCQAEKLKVGESLMPLYRRTGYEEVWQPDVDDGRWQATHKLVADTIYGPALADAANHKVVSIRSAGMHVVYDMQVEKHHNFALTAGVFTHNTPYQIWTQGQIPVAKYIIQQVPPTNIIHLKINVSSQEKRGRSDLLPAMPWFKRFNDFYNGQTIKAVLEANLVFKIKVKGDAQDVEAFLQNPALTELPPPGGTWIENEAVDLQATSTQLTAGRGSQGIGQQIAAIIAASMNLPSEYFNIEGTGPARATALVRTDPAVKTIEDRQQLLREVADEIYERVIADAINSKRLDPSKARRDPERIDEWDQDIDDDDDKDDDDTPRARRQARLIRTVNR